MKVYLPVVFLSVMMLTQQAFAQQGRVATACKEDIAKYCADRPHDGSVRACLWIHYDQVSKSCQKALDTTGGRHGKRVYE